MDEILRLFRKRLFYETMRAKQNVVDLVEHNGVEANDERNEHDLGCVEAPAKRKRTNEQLPSTL